MEDHAVSRGRREPDEGHRGSILLKGGREATRTSPDGAPSAADVEVESLKRRLALYEKERDAIHERAAAILRMSEAVAASARHEAEAKAQEIIRRATVEAELLELRARMQVEEMRAREVGQLWSRMDRAVDETEVGSSTVVPNRSAPVPMHDGEQQTTGSTGFGETATDERTEPVAEGTQHEEENSARAEANSDLSTSVPVDESVPSSVAQPSEPDDQKAVSGEQCEMAGGPGEARTSEAPAEGHQATEAETPAAAPDSGLASAEVVEAESATDETTQPPIEVRSYRVREPLTSNSMIAMEQAAGRLAGVLSAKMSLSPDGAQILTVSSHDSRRTE